MIELIPHLVPIFLDSSNVYCSCWYSTSLEEIKPHNIGSLPIISCDPNSNCRFGLAIAEGSVSNGVFDGQAEISVNMEYILSCWVSTEVSQITNKSE